MSRRLSSSLFGQNFKFIVILGYQGASHPSILTFNCIAQSVSTFSLMKLKLKFFRIFIFGFVNIQILWKTKLVESIFVILNIYINLPCGHVRSHTNLDSTSSAVLTFLDKNIRTDKQSKYKYIYIDDWYFIISIAYQ